LGNQSALGAVYMHVYDFPYESPYDLLQIGWRSESPYDKNIERLHVFKLSYDFSYDFPYGSSYDKAKIMTFPE
jgi:hypothetical protein